MWGGGVKENADIFKIGITCSGGMSYKATEEYKRSQGLKISAMYYRGDGWPGKNCLLSSNKTIESDHQGSLFERMFSSQIFKNPGCRNCRDHFAENADISFCDFWDRREMSVEKEGNSCVITRNERLEGIFSKLQDEGYVEIVRELNEKEVINSQYQVLLAKKGDIREKKQFRLFMRVVDYIFKHRIYKLFSIRIYKKFCTYYNRMCRNSHI